MPTVAAINGDCLGGGMELALACTYRVAADDGSTTLGLPEVKLGLIPAWGGATHLPRMIGLAPALRILLAGRTMPPREAWKHGLVDEVVRPEELRPTARRLVLSGREPIRPRRWERAAGGLAPVRSRILAAARRQCIEPTYENYPAPPRLLEVVEAGHERGVAAGLVAEREAILQLMQTGATRNLLRLFFLRQAAKRRAAGRPSSIVADPSAPLADRLAVPYCSEALAALGEGASVPWVDDAMRRWGMLTGPFEWMDDKGLDVVNRLLDSQGQPSDALRQAVTNGWLGRRSGKGFYLHGGTERGGAQVPPVHFELASLIAPRGESQSPSRPVARDELQWRLILAMVNEAARAFSDGAVDSGDDIDLATVLGLGFAPFRGGLARFVEDAGAEPLVCRLEEHAARLGPRFTPAELLYRMARDRRPFPR